MQIEKMNVSDCARAAEIEKLCFSVPWSRESLENEFNLDYAVYFAAKEDGLTVGYVGIHNVCDEGEITMIAVHPQYRRRGIAEKLLDTLVLHEQNIGVLRINLEVRKSNLPAQCLYRKLGFKVDGIRKKYYTEPTEDAVLMSIDLNRKDD